MEQAPSESQAQASPKEKNQPLVDLTRTTIHESDPNDLAQYYEGGRFREVKDAIYPVFAEPYRTRTIFGRTMPYPYRTRTQV